MLAEWRERGGEPAEPPRSRPSDVGFVALFLAVFATFLVGAVTIAVLLWRLVS